VFISCENSDLDIIEYKLSINDTQSTSINKQPIAKINIAKDTILQEDKEIIFNGEDSFDTDGKIVKYSWKQNDEVISNKSTINLKFKSGFHIVELEVEDNNGAIGVVRKQINIKIDYKKINLDLDDVEELITLAGATKEIKDIKIKDNHLFSSSNDGSIYRWELAINKISNLQKIIVHKDYIVSAMLINDDTIYTGSNDNSIRIWDKDTLKIQKILKIHTNTITSITRDDTIIVSSSNDKIINILDIKNNTLITTLKGHKSAINNVVIIKNFIISSSVNKTIRVWDKKLSYKNVNIIDTIKYNVDFMKRYKENIITISKDGDIVIWDIFKGVIISKVKSKPITAFDIYKDYIIVATSDNNINYYDINTLSKVNILHLPTKVTSISVGEGILAIALDNLNIKLFGSKINFERR
jgi:WD40 repeat protein